LEENTMNILLGLTGSVATTIAPKIISALESLDNVDEIRVVMTDKACMFQNPEALARKCGIRVYTERDEWTWQKEIYDGIPAATPSGLGTCFITTDKWEKGFPVLHVELAKWASVIVIAPASMNTIGKIAQGLTDNILTSIIAARQKWTPLVIAPAMNTKMWESTACRDNIRMLMGSRLDIVERNIGDVELVSIVPPVSGLLACGDTGVGALADTANIASETSMAIRWCFPMTRGSCPGIPVGKHLGAFGAFRKHDRHCGVDLYCPEGTQVMAVEDGTIVSIEDFTGPAAGCPWWMDTKCIKIEGPSGIICYGEIAPYTWVSVGKRVRKGAPIATVIPVLRPGKKRDDIPGHSRSMLHMQIYTRGSTHKDYDWGMHTEMPSNIIDPTPLLLASDGHSQTTLDME
jgi:phosphopantothenoylcysteine decarboxylase